MVKICLAVGLALLMGLLVLIDNKASWGIIIFISISMFYIIMGLKSGIVRANQFVLYIIVFSIPFPFFIQFMRRDAITVTTLLISFLFVSLFISRQLKAIWHWSPKAEVLLPSILVIIFTIALILNPVVIEQSFKIYLGYISGILVYYLVVAIANKRRILVTILQIILGVLVGQFLLCLLYLRFPMVGKYLICFGTRLSTAESFLGVDRLKGTIGDFELLAEWFLVGTILAMGLIYQSKKNIYSIPFLCCFGGIVITRTRSDMTLAVFAIMLAFVVLSVFGRNSLAPSVRIIFLGLLGILFVILFAPKQGQDIIARFIVYFGYRDILASEAINRKEVWDIALNVFLREPKVFGNGFYIFELSNDLQAMDFHSLYLTILYRIGIAGLGIHILFWFTILRGGILRLLRKRTNQTWHLNMFLLMAVIMMLLDQIKVEYVRYVHTIQFAWLIFGLLAVCGKEQREEHENTLVSSITVGY